MCVMVWQHEVLQHFKPEAIPYETHHFMNFAVAYSPICSLGNIHGKAEASLNILDESSMLPKNRPMICGMRYEAIQKDP